MNVLSKLAEWGTFAAANVGEGAAEHGSGLLTKQAVTDVWYLWLIPLFPVVGAALNAVLGHWIQRRFGKRWTSHVAIGAMVASLITACVAWGQLASLPEAERFLRTHLWQMLTAGDVQADLSFALDPLSMLMVLVITFVGTLIHVYSVGYMADDPGYWRFFCYLNLFVFSMLLLVMGDNFVLMFFGWEGVGLCSYLLIGFWYEDIDKARAAVKAFVTNRFGDFGFVLGLFLLFWALGGEWKPQPAKVPERERRWQLADRTYVPVSESGWSYRRDDRYTPGRLAARPEELSDPLTRATKPFDEGQTVVKAGPTLNFRELRDQLSSRRVGMIDRLQHTKLFGIGILAWVGLLLFIGATAKSAQIPLYVWLPDAMAGPTPVSALIHAATMVTAGVYMVARLNFLFALSTAAMTAVAVTGAATALFAATIGFFQYDIKKVLAYSTVSQLGFMFIGVGVGAYWAGIYHLLTHAFFKACLFLGSGSVILGCHHEQDMRRMGGLKKHMPLTERTYWYACIAISGFPIANGFFSKDEILWKAFSAGKNMLYPWLGTAIWFVGWITALGTSFYMWRSYYMTFTGEYRGQAHGQGSSDHQEGAHAHAPAHPHESPKSMTYVLVTLAVGCLVTALLGFWAPLGHLLHNEWLAEPLVERWLAPVFAPSHGWVTTRVVSFESSATEWLLVALSVGVAFVGWWIARTLYLDAKSTVPATLMAKFPGIHRVVFNKYYVDELYEAVVLGPTRQLSKALSAFDGFVIDGVVHGFAWAGRAVAVVDGAIDTYLVDGAVDATATAVRRAGKVVRRAQTGRLQTYLYTAMAGALIVMGLNYLFR